VDLFHGVLEPEDCLLSQTDSSSASGWLRKSNFADKVDENIQLTTTRKLANLLIESDCNLYSQWFPGDNNAITDSLSRDFHIPDAHLSFLLESHVPEQAPFGLKILPLPPDIISWLTCLLHSQPQKEQWLRESTQSKFMLGLDSNCIYNPLDCHLTHTLTTSPVIKNLKFSAPLLNPSEKADFVLEHILAPSSQIQSKPPWTMWLRPFDWPVDQTLILTTTKNLHTFYNANSEDMPPPITHPFHKQL
jgi:hypothetical protein